jgi:hypothetical protein
MRKLLLVILVVCIAAPAFSQGANSAQFGVMYTMFKKESPFKRNLWPGFSVNAFGFSVSYYSGRNKYIDWEEQSVDETYTVGGSFFDIGYKYEFQTLSPFKKLIKRPFFYPTLGAGIGAYTLNERTGFQFNLRPGFKLAILPGVAVFAEAYAEINVLNDDVDDVKETSIKGKYFVPTAGIEFKTDLNNILNEVWGPKRELSEGWVTVEYKNRDGITMQTDRYYREKGTYVQDYFMQSRNVVNLYGGILLGTGAPSRGATIAGTAGLAFRYGMFALDLEYAIGKIGYRYDDSDARMQNSWEMRRFSSMIGIDLFHVHKAFDTPGFIRIIIGAKLGAQSFMSKLDKFSETQLGVDNFDEQNFRNKFFAMPHIAIEYGTLGFTFEGFRVRDAYDKGYKSGIIIGARYMIPLYMVDAE